jgi:hypothetical protein
VDRVNGRFHDEYLNKGDSRIRVEAFAVFES